MQARANGQTDAARRVANRTGAADRPCRPVEGSEKAVACRVDLAAAEMRDLASRQTVIPFQQVPPGPVAHLGCALGRADDVGEQHGREDTILLRRLVPAGEELLDRVQNKVGFADVKQMLVAGHLHELRPRDALGHVATVVSANVLVVLAVQHQRRHANGG